MVKFDKYSTEHNQQWAWVEPLPELSAMSMSSSRLHPKFDKLKRRACTTIGSVFRAKDETWCLPNLEFDKFETNLNQLNFV